MPPEVRKLHISMLLKPQLSLCLFKMEAQSDVGSTETTRQTAERRQCPIALQQWRRDTEENHSFPWKNSAAQRRLTLPRCSAPFSALLSMRYSPHKVQWKSPALSNNKKRKNKNITHHQWNNDVTRSSQKEPIKTLIERKTTARVRHYLPREKYSESFWKGLLRDIVVEKKKKIKELKLGDLAPALTETNKSKHVMEERGLNGWNLTS